MICKTFHIVHLGMGENSSDTSDKIELQIEAFVLVFCLLIPILRFPPLQSKRHEKDSQSPSIGRH